MLICSEGGGYKCGHLQRLPIVYVYLCFCLLLALAFSGSVAEPTVAASDLAPSATAVPIFHTLHEGSHAMLASLAASRSCIFHISEYLDIRFYSSREEQKRAYKEYLRPGGIDPIALYNAILGGKRLLPHNSTDAISLATDMKTALTCANSGHVTLIIALVRLDLVSLEALTASDANRNFFILARTDLMRFSLSVFKSGNFSSWYQQFDRPAVRPKVHYNITDLQESAKFAQRQWKLGAGYFHKLSAQLRVPCDRIYFLRYEDYCTNSTAFCIAFYDVAATGSAGVRYEYESRSSAIPKRKVHKVHSSNISSFVENSDEVEMHFKNEQYAPYEDVLRSNMGEACPSPRFLLQV